ncbi:MAG: MFS transporter [Erysipelotrichaceae bacterium]|nr:MFS transporter [Erysipelotrichaceae bacterium]
MKNKSVKHWIILIIASFLTASVIGVMVNASGVFYTPIAEEWNELRGSVSMHGMFNLFSGAIASLFVAKVLRRYPFKALIFIGTLISSLATLLMGLSTNVLMLNILATIRGAFSSIFGIVTINLIINNWFFKYKGVALSVALSFSGIAGAIFAPVFTNLIIYIGWQKSYFVMASVIFACSLPAILIPFKLNPREEGLLPYGYEEEKVKEVNAKAIKPAENFNIFQIKFILMFIFSLFISSISAIAQHFPGYSVSISYTAAMGASMLSFAMYGNIMAKLLIGFLSDLKGPVFATATMLIVNTFSLIIILLAPSSLYLLIGSILFGSCYSVGAVGVSLLTSYYFGQENYQKIFPIVSFAGTSGNAIGLPIFGYIYDFTGSYTLVFLVSIIMNIFNVVIVIYIYNKKLKDDKIELA